MNTVTFLCPNCYHISTISIVQFMIRDRKNPVRYIRCSNCRTPIHKMRACGCGLEFKNGKMECKVCNISIDPDDYYITSIEELLTNRAFVIRLAESGLRLEYVEVQ